MDESSEDRPGRVIAGRYTLIEKIGEGGMGSVWLARQTDAVTRLVALKLIKVGLNSAEGVARFEVERQALAIMDHPNIATVLDVGTARPGVPFFVMEFLKGMPITQYCEHHKLSLRDRLQLFVPVCQAIQHAHYKGVIHRDIKPTNILVTRHDDKPVPKVIDFGLAKATGIPLIDQTPVTGLAIVGTLEYMSPEQATLINRDVDTRSDVYSLGVVLYAMLTGETPLKRRQLAGLGLQEVLNLVREMEVTRPSAWLRDSANLAAVSESRGVDPRRLIELLQNELDWVVMKSLEKDRRLRYDSPAQLAKDLENFLEGRPVFAASPSFTYRTRKFVNRNRRVLQTAGLILLVLATLGGFWRMHERQLRAGNVDGIAERYLEADVERLPSLLKEMAPFRGEVESSLDGKSREKSLPAEQQLKVDLARLSADPTAAARIKRRILKSGPREAKAVGLVLSETPAGWADALWHDVKTSGLPSDRVRIAAVLAQFDAQNPRWSDVASVIADDWVEEGDYRAIEWVDPLRPILPRLESALAAMTLDSAGQALERRIRAARLISGAVEEPQKLAGWLLESDEKTFPFLWPEKAELLRDQARFFQEEASREGSSRRRLNACGAWLRINPDASLVALLEAGLDPELRGGLTHQLPMMGIQASTIASQFLATTEPRARSLWLQALGGYSSSALSPEQRDAIVRQCVDEYPEQNDIELRSSQEWILRQWAPPETLAAGERLLQNRESMERRRARVFEIVAVGREARPEWFATHAGQVMIAFARPGEFNVGLRASALERYPLAGSSAPLRIPRSFAIGMKPVTAAQFREYQPEFKVNRHFSKDSTCPALDLTWSEAAGYCNWLSEQENLQPVYERNSRSGTFSPRANALALDGYRLPTEAEWEYACRGGTKGPRFYGRAEDAEHYCGPQHRSSPVGRTKPNPFGLFDLHGNVLNWCHDGFSPTEAAVSSPANDQAPAGEEIGEPTHRILRGSSFLSEPEAARSDLRSWAPATDRYITYGFRLARTLAVLE